MEEKNVDECLKQLTDVENAIIVMLNEFEEHQVVSWEAVRQFKLAVFELLLDWEKAKDNTEKYA